MDDGPSFATPEARTRSCRIAERRRRHLEEGTSLRREDSVSSIVSFSSVCSDDTRNLTTQEKEYVLKSLHLHGSRRMARLCGNQADRSTSEEALRSAIRRYRRPTPTFGGNVPISCPVSRNRTRDTAIETWIAVTEGDGGGSKPKGRVDGSPAVVAVLDYIAKCEPHPDPFAVGGVDYAAIYTSLADLASGEVPRDLNPATSRKMLEMMNRLKESVVTNKDITAEDRRQLEMYRVPEGSAEEDTDTPLSSINVLGLPQEFFTIDLK